MNLTHFVRQTTDGRRLSRGPGQRADGPCG